MSVGFPPRKSAFNHGWLGLLGLAGMAGLGRARRSRLRGPCLLFSLGTIAMVVPPFIIATFDWRYELPQFSLIPIAAVLAVTAMAGWDRERTPAPTTTGQAPGESETPSQPRSAETVPAVRRLPDDSDARDLPDDHFHPPA